MKALILTLVTLMTMTAQAGQPSTCSYTLDAEEYWEDASGDLVLDGVNYRCHSEWSEDGQQMTTCTSDKNQNWYYINFDGAEASFFVTASTSTGDINDVCQGTAGQK